MLPNYSSSRVGAHLMFLLFPENRKSIPKFLVVKTFQKCNPQDFKFYLSNLTNAIKLTSENAFSRISYGTGAFSSNS